MPKFDEVAIVEVVASVIDLERQHSPCAYTAPHVKKSIEKIVQIIFIITPEKSNVIVIELFNVSNELGLQLLTHLFPPVNWGDYGGDNENF